MLKSQTQTVAPLIKEVYELYSGFKAGDHDMSRGPQCVPIHVVYL
jgi:hypothetical protein